jgi:hypothetical protein
MSGHLFHAQMAIPKDKFCLSFFVEALLKLQASAPYNCLCFSEIILFKIAYKVAFCSISYFKITFK